MPIREKLPSKLKDDSISEAVFEIRFSTPSIEELVIGRMANWAEIFFGSIEPTRTGAADLPAPIRSHDENLRFQSLLDIAAKGQEGGERLIRISGASFAYVTRNRYCGWEKWRPELQQAIETLFSRVNDLSVIRLGLRYTNLMMRSRHFVEGFQSLAIAINMSGKKIEKNLNLNVIELAGTEHSVLYRIADPAFLSGKIENDAALAVDIDVSTPVGVAPKNVKQVLDWLDSAHNYEKKAFFELLPDDLLEKLEEQ